VPLLMSTLPPIADIVLMSRHVRFGSNAEMRFDYPITSPASKTNDSGIDARRRLATAVWHELLSSRSQSRNRHAERLQDQNHIEQQHHRSRNRRCDSG
jgi:hypothetical protein